VLNLGEEDHLVVLLIYFARNASPLIASMRFLPAPNISQKLGLSLFCNPKLILPIPFDA
jgi:hypothetical protein